MKYNFIVDSHCHLDLIAQKGGDIDQVIKNANESNVKILQTICTKISKFDEIYAYAKKYDNVYASVGVHPNNVDDEGIYLSSQIVEICKNNDKVIGIGETGLDYYYDYADKKNQIISFENHIIAAQETGLPLIIHSRDADRDMMEILKKFKKQQDFKALLHCFSSTKKLAKCALDLGILISISGIVTFKNALDLQEIVKTVPMKSLLVETDSPYLAPMPHRGKSNQPAYTKHVVQKIAEIKGLDFNEVTSKTTENFYRFFNLESS